MATFNFDDTVPAANNNPSADQPILLANNVSIRGILNEDHVSFDTASGGTHKQVTLSSKNTPGAQTDPQSVLYSASGTASTVADLYFRNQNAIFPISLVRAYAVSTSVGGILGSQSHNVTSVTSGGVGTGVYTVVMPANVVTGTSYGIQVSMTGDSNPLPMLCRYTITSATSFQLRFFVVSLASLTGIAAADPTNFTFTVLQK